MTCREQLKTEHPDNVNSYCTGGCHGCPHNYGYLDKPDYCEGMDDEICTKCWDRQIPGNEGEEHMYYHENLKDMSWDELADLATNQHERIENLLGELHEMEDDLRNRDADISNKDRRIEMFTKIYNRNKETIKRLEDTIEAKENRIVHLEGINNQLKDTIKDQNNKIVELMGYAVKGEKGDTPYYSEYYSNTAAHIWRKFEALCDAGFSTAQAMQLIPLWTDDEETED